MEYDAKRKEYEQQSNYIRERATCLGVRNTCFLTFFVFASPFDAIGFLIVGFRN